ILNVTYLTLDGTQKTLILYETTNAAGKIEFVINGTVTAEISEIQMINAAFVGDISALPSNAIIVDSTQIPSFEAPVGIETVIRALLPLILIGLAVLIITAVGARRYTASRQVQRAYAAQVMQEFHEIKALGYVLIRTQDGVPLYSENFLSIEADRVILSGMTTAISSFIEDVANKAITGSLEKSEFEEMIKSGFNMLARDGDFTTIVLLSDVPLEDSTKKNVRALQTELESTFQDELENFFSVEDLDLDLIRRLVEKHLYTPILKNIIIKSPQLAQKVQLFTPKDRKIINNLKYVPRTMGSDTFFADSFISAMQQRNISRVDAQAFLMKLNRLGLLSAMTYEELLASQQEQSEQAALVPGEISDQIPEDLETWEQETEESDESDN
ncbi:MAG: hypothetical protein ACFFBD_24395, partial [Candidatus Hodarchaeota archaeon]